MCTRALALHVLFPTRIDDGNLRQPRLSGWSRGSSECRTDAPWGQGETEAALWHSEDPTAAASDTAAFLLRVILLYWLFSVHGLSTTTQLVHASSHTGSRAQPGLCRWAVPPCPGVGSTASLFLPFFPDCGGRVSAWPCVGPLRSLGVAVSVCRLAAQCPVCRGRGLVCRDRPCVGGSSGRSRAAPVVLPVAVCRLWGARVSRSRVVVVVAWSRCPPGQPYRGFGRRGRVAPRSAGAARYRVEGGATERMPRQGGARKGQGSPGSGLGRAYGMRA